MAKCANYKANSRGRILVLTGLLEVSEWVKIILGGSISWTYIHFWQILYGFLKNDDSPLKKSDFFRNSKMNCYDLKYSGSYSVFYADFKSLFKDLKSA